MNDAFLREIGSSFVVDARRCVVDTSAPEPALGEVLTGSSWLGRTLLEAIDAAEMHGRTQRRIACDSVRGTHWLVVVSVAELEPWRARVAVIDTTPSIHADREAFISKLVHSVRNTSFALTSTLSALAEDRPDGTALDEYLEHLREPAARLTELMAGLASCLQPAPLSPRRVRVDALVRRVLSRSSSTPPPAIALRAPGMMVKADIEHVADAIAALLDSCGGMPQRTLSIDRIDVAARPHVAFFVDRPAAPGECSRATAWDITGRESLELQVRLAVARSVIVAHGGTVVADGGTLDAERLGVCLPLVEEA